MGNRNTDLAGWSFQLYWMPNFSVKYIRILEVNFKFILLWTALLWLTLKSFPLCKLSETCWNTSFFFFFLPPRSLEVGCMIVRFHYYYLFYSISLVWLPLPVTIAIYNPNRITGWDRPLEKPPSCLKSHWVSSKNNPQPFVCCILRERAVKNTTVSRWNRNDGTIIFTSNSFQAPVILAEMWHIGMVSSKCW